MINREKIELLPNWYIADKHPAFYDTESATAIEMVAKLYGAMRKLQESHNNFTEEIDKKIEQQNNVIAETIEYMKTNIVETTTNIVNQKIEDGEIILKHTYDEINKKVSLIITNINAGGIE